MKIKEVNLETGQEIVRDATNAEITQREADGQASLQRQAENEAKAAQKAALLNRLGITEDEAKLLLS